MAIPATVDSMLSVDSSWSWSGCIGPNGQHSEAKDMHELIFSGRVVEALSGNDARFRV